MAELTKEQFAELPEFLASQYVEDGDGYTHGGFLKVKGTADKLDERSKQTAKELEDYQSKESERIEQARLDAYEKAKKEGNIEEIEKRHKQQLEDAVTRERESAKLEAREEFQQEQAQEKADKLALTLAADIAIDEFSRDFIHMAIKERVKVDPKTGEEVYFDDEGRATSLKREAYREELLKNPRFARLVKAGTAPTGGGNANGSGRGSASGKKFNEMTSGELTELNRTNPQAYQKLRNEYYSK